jgi:hypothetical protein
MATGPDSACGNPVSSDWPSEFAQLRTAAFCIPEPAAYHHPKSPLSPRPVLQNLPIPPNRIISQFSIEPCWPKGAIHPQKQVLTNLLIVPGRAMQQLNAKSQPRCVAPRTAGTWTRPKGSHPPKTGNDEFADSPRPGHAASPARNHIRGAWHRQRELQPRCVAPRTHQEPGLVGTVAKLACDSARWAGRK